MVVYVLHFIGVFLGSFPTLSSRLPLAQRFLPLQLRLETPPEVQQPVPELLILGPKTLQLRGDILNFDAVQIPAQSIAQIGDFFREEANLVLLRGQACSQALRHL